MEIRHNERAGLHNFGLDRATRDALATYVKLRWPTGTAKMAAREWDISLDEARGIVACRSSLATLDRIFKHKRGGWPVILPVFGAVVGQTIHEHLHEEIRNAAREQRELEQHAEAASLAHRRLALRGRPAGLAVGPDRPAGEAGHADGALGPDPARRVG